ncbi:hypothetical protein J7L60_02130 [Candidatus Bathyarchaeota archaeon]|nr:hypothetical protein [Candidatus Bathyarchaeota archaeon]
MTVVVTRIKFFKKSGARIYLPSKIVKDPDFPFEDDDLVKIEIGNDSLRIERPEWWEMLDWNELREAYETLPEEIKRKIAERGLAPK